MDDKLKKILSRQDEQAKAGEQELFDYLNNELTDEEKYALEVQMNDDEFMSDAMEGLEDLKEQDVRGMVKHLNAGLKRQLQTKKRSRRKNYKEGPWVYYTIVILLLLIIIGFVVIRKFIVE